MRLKIALVVACGAVALASAANAQQVTVDPSAASVTHLGDHDQVVHPAGDGDLSLNVGGQTVGGAHYSSDFNVGSQISFESGSVAVGDQVYRSQSISSIALNTYFDGTKSGGQLLSQITAAGLGFYVTSGNCFSSPMSCAQSMNPADNFSAFAVGSGADVQTLATVSFNFAVVQDGETLTQFTGSLDLNAQNGAYSIDMTNAPTALSGLRTLQFGQPDSDFGYAWNATNLPVNLNPITGDSTISYIATVTSETNAPCLADGACLLAYSGFGDPIGGGGEISSNILASDGPLTLGSSQGLNSTCPVPTSLGDDGNTYINCVTFSPTTFNLPSFDGNGNLVFTQGGVPEPASWALMILGFGAMGAALRRRKVLAYT